MTLVTETAYAKLNLALHVRARRPDGYHEIETIFAFCADGDTIIAEAADGLSLTTTGLFADGLPVDESNLVIRAAQAMLAHFKVRVGARISLDKRLPVAAGLGGGSADAAAVARALNRLWGLNASECELCAAIGLLGADVAACVPSRAALGKGVGDILGPPPADMPAPGTPLLLVNPLKLCPTGPVYQGWDGADRGSLAIARAGWRNDLTPGAVALVPEIGVALYLLDEIGTACFARMSGSGATCFALFDTEAARDAARDEIAAQQPGWWTCASVLR